VTKMIIGSFKTVVENHVGPLGLSIPLQGAAGGHGVGFREMAACTELRARQADGAPHDRLTYRNLTRGQIEGSQDHGV
jgi:hypothetical protein